MHDDDLELLTKETQPDGSVVYRVRIRPLGMERDYQFFPDAGRYQICGAERKILVAGHDMTSIIGKRVREFLESRRGS